MATRAQIERQLSRTRLDRALADGAVVRVARGRYVLAETAAATALAHAVGGVLSHSSAALVHGWPVLSVDERVHVTVPRGSRARAAENPEVVLHHSRLDPDDVRGDVTGARRTVVDCLRQLPWREALAVADSALRAGWSSGDLVEVAAGMQGRGAARARAVAAAASPLADNPLESALRAIAHEVAGLDMVPQVEIGDRHGFIGRVDLADRRRRIVAEADSFAWHGSRPGLVRDAQRYNRLTVAGWWVLRFTWDEVVLRPEAVSRTLQEATERRTKVALKGL